MITALIPIQSESSFFWSSDKGRAQTDTFLRWLAATPDIDRILILSTGSRISSMAEKQGMQFLHAEETECIDGPFTFLQSVDFANIFRRLCFGQHADMMVLDHRSLLFSQRDLKKALSAYKRYGASGLVSVAPCIDHPCQLRSYHRYLGCRLFYFNKHSNGGAAVVSPCVSHSFNSVCAGSMDIVVTSRLRNSRLDVSFEFNNPIRISLTAHVLPFNEEGPIYNFFKDISVGWHSTNTTIDVAPEGLSGVIITLLANDESGSYDTEVFFSPAKADWELGDSNTTVVNKKDQKPVQGRQQFTPTYSYDGTFFMICSERLDRPEEIRPVPFELDQSCIVTDWVDYHYCSTRSTGSE